jgi:hypothetical protein
VAFAVFICLLLTGIQTVLAVSTSSIYGPFIAPGPLIGNEPLSPFDATFIHMIEASASLSSGTYTFEITVYDTPADWMQPAWQPTFVAPHENTKLSIVGYNWMLFDASGHFMGMLHYGWVSGTIVLYVTICPQGSNLGCLISVGSGKGLGSETHSLPVADASYSGKSVTVTISASELGSLFTGAQRPTPAQWRALAAGCPMASTSANSCTVYITTVRLGFA